jgi:hypothetical protein
METKTLSAQENPQLASQLAAKALKQDEAPEKAQITSPSEVVVDLPGGYITLTGEVLRTAEVRELNGKDEEAIAKSGSYAKSLNTLLARGTVKIGEQPATEPIIDGLLAADRDSILLGIYRATFGDTAVLNGYCNSCKEYKEVEVDIRTDIDTKVLVDPIADREFVLEGKKATYTLRLPSSKAQKEIANSMERTGAELDTLLLEYCVIKINEKHVYHKSEVQNIGLADRRAILKEIIARNPGPQFNDVKVSCDECGGEVVVPISIGALFRV